MTAQLTVRTVLATAIGRLSVLDAELLLSHVLGTARSWLIAHSDDPLPSREVDRFSESLERAARGEPLAYILGYKEFWSLRLAVSPAVLVPRPETELLVERALALHSQSTGRVADLGTGSGAIALALARERPGWSVVATDISEEALKVARGNAAAHGLSQIEFLPGRWLDPLEGRKFNLIVSNPPYIDERDPAMRTPALRHEPRIALTPGADALASIREIVQSAPPRLEPNGWLLLEHGSDQAAAVARELVARGFTHVRSHRDLAGHERMTEGRRPNDPAPVSPNEDL